MGLWRIIWWLFSLFGWLVLWVLLLVLTGGCATSQKADGDIVGLLARLNTRMDTQAQATAELAAKIATLDNSVRQQGDGNQAGKDNATIGDNSVYSDGALYVLAMGVVAFGALAVQHWRSSKHRHTLDGKLNALARAKEQT